MNNNKYYTMKDACRQLGVCKNTIINWEKKGLIKPRRDKILGYRYWTEEDLKQIKKTTVRTGCVHRVKEAA